MNIPITKPSINEQEKEAILKPLESGWLVQGPFVAEFEKLFSTFVGVKFAKAASSCTTALHLALEALGIGAGDKVIVPAFTYVASANAVEYTGATVVFCDIDLRTFNINPVEVEALLEKDKKREIKGIIPVNLFGLCANLPILAKLASQRGISMVEDSACGVGAYLEGRHSGTFGEAGCFSFHPRKSITTGEGGMVVTDDAEIASRIGSLRDHGAGKSDLERHQQNGGSLLPEFNMRGYNYRMTDLQGALGVCQMRKARLILEKRKKIAEKYDRFFKDIRGLVPPHVPEGYVHGYQSYVCLFIGGEESPPLDVAAIDRLNVLRNRFMSFLETKGISVRQGTHAVHTLGHYAKKYGFRVSDFPNAYAADRLSVAFPLYADMTDNEFDYVAENIKTALSSAR